MGIPRLRVRGGRWGECVLASASVWNQTVFDEVEYLLLGVQVLRRPLLLLALNFTYTYISSMNTTSLIIALLCGPLSSAFQLQPLAHRRGVEVGVRGVVCPSSSYSSSRRTDTYCAGVEEGDSPRTLYERLAINLFGGIPSFPHPFKTLVADQLNEKSSDTGRSLVEDAKAIVAAAGEDFKAGQKTLGKAMVSSTRIICLTINNGMRGRAPG